MKASHTQTSFVFGEIPVLVGFLFEHPRGGEGPDIFSGDIHNGPDI
jgi:hypothetical protein